MAEATAKPSGFQFRFSLRTLFVVVTVLGCWLGWQANIVRQRATERERIEAAGGQFSERVAQASGGKSDYRPYYYAHVSLLRSLMGDRPCAKIVLPEGFTQDERDAVKKQFDEAVYVWRAYDF